MQKSEDELLPHYIAVANTANDVAQVIKGNDRVMRPRLADAQFFFEKDKRTSAEELVGKLGGIVFHNRLGSVREKVSRVQALAAWIAGKIGADASLVARAAHLAKADLVSLMVGEFPELQGHMGRAYAMHAGEPQAVADAIRDHYKPVGASDDVAPTDVGAIVALADRLDTIVGCFAVNLAPTGTADPFALRRACLARPADAARQGGPLRPPRRERSARRGLRHVRRKEARPRQARRRWRELEGFFWTGCAACSRRSRATPSPTPPWQGKTSESTCRLGPRSTRSSPR